MDIEESLTVCLLLTGRPNWFRDHTGDPTSMSDQVNYNKSYEYPASEVVEVPPHVVPFHQSIPRDRANCEAQEGQRINPKVNARLSNSCFHSLYTPNIGLALRND